MLLKIFVVHKIVFPDAKKKKHLLIYQSKVNAPHFKVLLEDDVLNPPKVRLHAWFM